MKKIAPLGFRFFVLLGAAGLLGGLVFLALLKGVHEVETTQFCGYTCHVMKPERVEHDFSPHAKVDCGTCHIGPGVIHLVQSKIEASRETYSMLTHSYPKPIVGPVKHLRPARFTCEQCHWPQKYYGDKKITKVHFGDDPDNTRQWVNLTMKTGGAEVEGREGHGIHWHIEQEVDYAAADEKRLVIPWVKVKRDGKETIFRLEGFQDADKLAVEKDRLRRMDCMDCHNRVAHVDLAPEAWLDKGMENGTLPTDLPYFKHQASKFLDKIYGSREDALKELDQFPDFYKRNLPKVFASRTQEINALPDKLMGIFDKTQFPEMNTNWNSNPNHLGHTQGGPGCFRCHDGKHVSEDGQTISQDCNLCHSRPDFGTGKAPQEMDHPILLKGTTHKTLSCDTCHNSLPSSDRQGLRSVQPPNSACFQCHDEADHPATAPMAKVACGECHVLHLGSPQSKGDTCLKCHVGIQDKGKHQAHLDLGLTCTQCHEKHTWKPDAKTFRKTCVTCHDGEKPAFIGKFLTAKP